MIVLASASPRRRELLGNAGIAFVVRPANISEIQLRDESPRDFAERMAREKARTVWVQTNSVHKNLTTQNTEYHREMPQSGVPVLGADTVVVVDDLVLGKPNDEQDAARMLRLLSGREHKVLTGVCLIGPSFEDVRCEITGVHFRDIREDEIRGYIASGEPMDKAGAYAIQGQASRWVLKIEGDYSNVVGLPVELVLRILREHKVL
ncbi:MAG TPA: Maf family protein [Terriglobales bacterium]|nr:Maf family protein [Terriglobales bacterium]